MMNKNKKFVLFFQVEIHTNEQMRMNKMCLIICICIGDSCREVVGNCNRNHEMLILH